MPLTEPELDPPLTSETPEGAPEAASGVPMGTVGADDTQDLIALDKQWGEAGVKGDMSVAEKLLAEQVVSVTTEGVRGRRGELADNEPLGLLQLAGLPARARGQAAIDSTPFGRFGLPDELIGTLIWLCSDASKFVTGVDIPVDGGFNVFCGV